MRNTRALERLWKWPSSPGLLGGVTATALLGFLALAASTSGAEFQRSRTSPATATPRTPRASSDPRLGGADDARCKGAGNVPEHVASPCDAPPPEADCHAGLCTIPPGCFTMGAAWCEWGRARLATDPVQVTLTHAFLIGENEVTQAEWLAVGLPNPSGELKAGGGDCREPSCPVGNISWFDALEFVNRRSRRQSLPECYELKGCRGTAGLGMTCDAVESTVSSIYECRGYRLPTGAEWEYAARAGTTGSVYSGVLPRRGPEYSCYQEPLLEDIAWYCNNSGSFTHPVGRKRPNAWGLHDMIGNAGEWVGSLAQPSYGDGPYVDPDATVTIAGLSAAKSTRQVAWRGGAWNMWPNTLRAAMVAPEPVAGRGPGIGLRVARTL